MAEPNPIPMLKGGRAPLILHAACVGSAGRPRGDLSTRRRRSAATSRPRGGGGSPAAGSRRWPQRSLRDQVMCVRVYVNVEIKVRSSLRALLPHRAALYSSLLAPLRRVGFCGFRRPGPRQGSSTQSTWGPAGLLFQRVIHMTIVCYTCYMCVVQCSCYINICYVVS